MAFKGHTGSASIRFFDCKKLLLLSTLLSVPDVGVPSLYVLYSQCSLLISLVVVYGFFITDFLMYTVS